jgi:hypothetical protein
MVKRLPQQNAHGMRSNQQLMAEKPYRADCCALILSTMPQQRLHNHHDEFACKEKRSKQETGIMVGHTPC